MLIEILMFIEVSIFSKTNTIYETLIKNFRTLFALLLLMHATNVYALPAEIHLNFCLGPDGHLRISLDFCAENLLSQQFQPLSPDFSVEDHHGDCLDIVLNCDAGEELFSPTKETLLAKTEITVNSPPLKAEEPIYFLSYQVNQSSLLNSHLIKGIPSKAHLGLISTTVLLI